MRDQLFIARWAARTGKNPCATETGQAGAPPTGAKGDVVTFGGDAEKVLSGSPQALPTPVALPSWPW